MGRISTIEMTAASGLPRYNNLKVIVRGRPRFIDPQLDGGTLRFAVKRGFNFSAIIPDNQAEITEDAYKDSYRITMGSRPTWMGVNTLIRLGNSEAIGELHIVRDTIDVNAIEVFTPIVTNYSASPDQSTVPVVSLIGTPCNVYVPTGSPYDKRIFTISSWYTIVPSDVILMTLSPNILESYQEYTVKRADLFGTREGNAGIGEPPTVYLYHIELDTKTGLLPFIPPVGSRFYLKALPLFFRGEWGSGDIEIPADVGPCLADAFFGSLLNTNIIETKLGIQTWDAFGQQANLTDSFINEVELYSSVTVYAAGEFVKDGLGAIYYSLVDNNVGNSITDTSMWATYKPRSQWQSISENHLILDRPITSDSLLFWQRITGNFQYQKAGYFQAELTSEGKFCFSSNLLVPKWPSGHEYGWVIPIFSRSTVTCVVQYEPQPQQIFEIPSNTLTFIRPKVKVIYNTITTGSLPLVTSGDRILTAAIDFTADPVMDTCTTTVNHGLNTGAKVQIETEGTIPSGLALQTYYYVIVDSPTTFRLADTIEHAKAGTGVVDITDAGVGIHRCTNPNINFLNLGLKSGHFFSWSGNLWEITNITANTFTIKGEVFPTTSSAVPFTILEQDLTPIDRILISFKGSPNSRVEIRDWQYDGTMVTALSYYILGTKEAYGQKRWLAGGFNIKPLFYNLAVLRARYSDGVSRYNSGHTYV
jgi:hypothetical protein